MVVNNAVSFIQNNIQNYCVAWFLCECKSLQFRVNKSIRKSFCNLYVGGFLSFKQSLVATEIDALYNVLKLKGEKKNGENCLTVVLFE